MKQAAWYEEKAGFFGPDYLAEYAKVISPQKTVKEVKFLIKVLKPKKRAKILDLACGHGRIAIGLAKHGFEVTGVDLNNFFLQKAKEEAKKKKAKINFIQKDMRHINFRGEFYVVINFFTAFGYFDSDRDDERIIQNVSRALKHGGKFLIDVINRDRIMRQFQPYKKEYIGKNSIIYERQWDPVKSTIYEKRTYTKGNRKKVIKNISIRLYTAAELIKIMAKAGLKFLKLYGNTDGKPYTIGSKRIIIIAQKR